MSSKKLRGSGLEKCLSPEVQQSKINEIKMLVGPVVKKFPIMCSDASISRFLRARNWNKVKASKMLRETIKWRLDYKPEKIQWEDIAQEAKTGKIYKANYFDKYGRTVLVMRPGFQNSSSSDGQIRYLVYCMENAIMNLKSGQEQMVWLIDFQGWNMSSISVKVARETAQVLQNRYPERLALAIFRCPPKVFESFWLMVKPFLERKTFKKVKFVYSDCPQSQKVMEELFDVEKLESAFGGKNPVGFDYEAYAKRMREDDKMMFDLIKSGNPLPSDQASILPTLQKPEESVATDQCSEGSDEDGYSSNDETASNLEGVNANLEDMPLFCEMVVNDEVDAAKKDSKIE